MIGGCKIGRRKIGGGKMGGKEGGRKSGREDGGMGGGMVRRGDSLWWRL